MDIDSPFERHMEKWPVPEPFRGAAIDVADTTHIAWLAAQSVFGDRATPELAIAMATLMLEAAGRIRQGTGTGCVMSPPDSGTGGTRD